MFSATDSTPFALRSAKIKKGGSRRPRFHFLRLAVRYAFFSSAGGCAVVLEVCAGGAGGGGVVPDMPSLNPRTPSPSPRISSGIFLPPNSTRMTIATISKCIGLSHMVRLPFPRGRPRIHCRNATRNGLNYNTFVADSPRHALPVEVFEQRNRIFSRDSDQVLKRRHGNLRTLAFFVSREALS